MTVSFEGPFWDIFITSSSQAANCDIYCTERQASSAILIFLKLRLQISEEIFLDIDAAIL